MMFATGFRCCYFFGLFWGIRGCRAGAWQTVNSTRETTTTVCANASAPAAQMSVPGWKVEVCESLKRWGFGKGFWWVN